MKRRIEYTPLSMPIRTMYNQRKNGILKFNKEYQRNLVWKQKMKIELLETVFFNMPIGSCIVWDTLTKKEVVDGMQRISCILSFVDNELKITGTVAKSIVEYFKEELEFENTTQAKKVLKNFNQDKNITITYDRLPLVMKDAFDAYQFSIIEIRHASLEQIRNYFVKVQNQEKLKAGEIIRSIPDSILVNELKELDLSVISEKLGFDNKREEMLKMLVVFHGIKKGKLGLNTSSKTIMNYIESEKEVDKIFIYELKHLIKAMKQEENIPSLSMKSELKYFFIGTLLGEDFHNNLSDYIIAVKQFVDDSKKLSSNDPKYADVRRAFMKKSPDKFKLTTLMKGSHSSKKIIEITPLYVKTVLNMIANNNE